MRVILLIFSLFAAVSIMPAIGSAQNTTSAYSFASTRQKSVDTKVTDMGKIIDSAEGLISGFEGERGLTIAMLCMLLASFSFLFDMRPAACAFGATAAFIVLINKPILAAAILLPYLLYKARQQNERTRRAAYFNGGSDVLPESLKERKSQKMQGQLNPLSDQSTAARGASPSSSRLSRPM